MTDAPVRVRFKKVVPNSRDLLKPPKKIYRLTDLKIDEISLVDFPAQQGARLLFSKAKTPTPRAHTFAAAIARQAERDARAVQRAAIPAPDLGARLDAIQRGLDALRAPAAPTAQAPPGAVRKAAASGPVIAAVRSLYGLP